MLENDEFYRFSKIKNPYSFDNDYFALGHAPIDVKDLEILYPNLEWDQITWGNQSVKIRDSTIQGLTSFKYYKKSGKV